MKRNQTLLIGYKLVFGLLGFAAIVTEIAALVDRGTFNFVNFFSFFTIQNNIFAVVAFLLGALMVASGKKSRGIDLFRAFSTVFIIVVGIGFAALLSGMEGVALTAVPWDNTVLHYIIPVALLIDFIIDTPKTRIIFGKSLLWLLYPAVYLTYTMIRGAITGWYPYPFLNPAKSSPLEIAVAVAGLVVLGVVLIWAMATFSKRRTARK